MAAPHIQLRDTLPRPSEAALLCAVRGAASLTAYASGFRALSDDDYARISIAQRFAELPHFDPSQTSWLPAPFWLYGTLFRLFGTELVVARVSALGLSTLATLLVYLAARWLGAGRSGALVAATLGTLLPYSALLGIAAIPEVPCAASILLGSAALARPDPTTRVLGGLCLAGACLARYEAWPVAALFAAVSLWDAWQDRRPSHALGAGLALLGPASWLMVGRLEHGDALFFVTRVASYRRALGGATQSSLWQQLRVYPSLLLRAEPELCGLLLVVVVLQACSPNRVKSASYGRAASALLALLAFLMLGGMRDGVPTHHAARVLLPIWFFACAACGHGLAQAFHRSSARPQRSALLGISAAALLAGLLARPRLLAPEAFAERELELAVGKEAKRRGVTGLAIDTPDYGYFAVQAGFGSPERSSVLDDHDPRHPRPNDSFASSAALTRALRARDAHVLVATRAHAALAAERCSTLWQNPGFVLLQCDASATTAAGGR